jgi:hypothetical protein
MHTRFAVVPVNALLSDPAAAYAFLHPDKEQPAPAFGVIACSG